MIDKRQIMYDIKRCISNVPGACKDCSHYTGTVGLRCMESLMADAYTLLKAQEAVKPKNDAFGHPYCPKCKVLVYQTWNYCPHCGQAVKWDD